MAIILNSTSQTLPLKIFFIVSLFILSTGCQENTEIKSLIKQAKQVDSQLWDKYSQDKTTELLEDIDKNGFSEKPFEHIALIFLSHGELAISQAILEHLSQKTLLADYDYYLAQIAIEKEAYKRADEYILKGLSKAVGADKVLFYLLRTKMMITLGEFEKAQNTLNSIIKIQPNNLHSKYIQAKLYLLIGDCEKAIVGYKELIKLAPQYKQFNAPLASAYRMCGKNELAKQHTVEHTKALLEFPNRFTDKKQELGNPVSALKSDIKAYISQNNINNAIRLLSELIQIDANNDSNYVNLGSMYFKINAIDKARIAFLKAFELNPNNVKASVNLGIVMMKQQNYEQAEYYFNNAITLQPLNLKATLNLAGVEIILNKPSEAESILQSLLDNHILNYSIQKAFILSLSMQNKYIKAFNDLTQWIKQDSNSKNLQHLRLNLLLQNFTLEAQQYNQIEGQILTQLKQYPSLVNNFVLLKAKYHKINELKEAIRQAKNLASINWVEEKQQRFTNHFNQIKTVGYLGIETFNEQ
jgi:Flp pilus assembly protein TadD